MKDHVMVTYYRDPLTGRKVMHAFGPYTEQHAQRERRRMLAEYADEANRGELSVAACKMIDIDAMNAELEQP